MTATKIGPLADDIAALPAVCEVARAAGSRLLSLYSPAARPQSRVDMFAAGRANEAAAMDGLQAALRDIRPQARWLEEEMETTALPSGEWWAVDSVEGNVNHVHGLGEWCVSITLIRDQVPVLTAVHQPVGDLIYTAVRGGGAHRNGAVLQVSAKKDLDAAIVATGQAEADQTELHRRLADSVLAMLPHALFVRTTVPSTFPMLLVALGQNDAFWQFGPVLPGIAAGILLISEAGGVISQIDGAPWQPGSPDVLAAAPGLHSAIVQHLGRRSPS